MNKFIRPNDNYQVQYNTLNIAKYQNDRDAVPTIPISASKIDADFNKIYDAAEEIWQIRSRACDNLKDSIGFIDNKLDKIERDLGSLSISGLPSPESAYNIYLSKDGSNVATGKIDNNYIKDFSITNMCLAKAEPGCIKVSDSNGSYNDMPPAEQVGTVLQIPKNGIKSPTYALINSDNLEPQLLDGLTEKNDIADNDQFFIADNVNRKNNKISWQNIKKHIPTPKLTEFASSNELNDITISNKAISPSVLLSLRKRISRDGYYELPGGLIIQWGIAPPGNLVVNFPISFPNNVFHVSTTAKDANSALICVTQVTKSGFNKINNFATTEAYWVALGN